jgi:DNA transposition AAA+ family ATPase
MEAITEDRVFDKAEAAELIRQAGEIQAADKLSNNHLAKILGISHATYSQVKRSKYTGEVQGVYRRIAHWLMSRTMKAEAPIGDYVNTRVGRYISAVCQRAWQMPTIGLVITRSGAGKTAALTAFVRRAGDRAYYLSAGEAASTKTGMLHELADALGVHMGHRSTSLTVYRDIRQKLADRYSGGKARPVLLIVDEATTLQPAALNMLRNLHDDGRCRLAVVLADTWRLHAELRNTRRLPGGYEQLRSRSGAQYIMQIHEEISAGDVKAIADSVLKSLGHNRELSQASYKYLTALAEMDGALRNVVHRLHAVHDLAEASGATPTYRVAELDIVAPLVGHACEIPDAENPFEDAAEARAEGRKEAV